MSPGVLLRFIQPALHALEERTAERQRARAGDEKFATGTRFHVMEGEGMAASGTDTGSEIGTDATFDFQGRASSTAPKPLASPI